jgi:hypothetical protein
MQGRIIIVIWLLLGSFVFSTPGNSSEIKKDGDASYVYGWPESFSFQTPEDTDFIYRFKGLPKKAYAREGLIPPSHSWFSSITWMPHSGTLFNKPFIYQYGEDGIRFFASRIEAGPTFQSEILIGRKMTLSLDGEKAGFTEITDYSEWMYTAATRYANGTITTTAVQGTPFIYVRYTSKVPLTVTLGGNWKAFTAEGGPAVSPVKGDLYILGDTPRGREQLPYAYGFYFFSDCPVTMDKKGLLLPASEKEMTFVVFDPGMPVTPDLLKTFRNSAAQLPVRTEVNWDIDYKKSLVTLHFQVETKNLGRGKSSAFCLGLYPHLWKLLKNNTDFCLTVDTVKGPLKILCADRLTVSLPLHGLLPYVPVEVPGDSGLRVLLQQDIQNKYCIPDYLKSAPLTNSNQGEAMQNDPDKEFCASVLWYNFNTYWDGKMMYKTVQHALVAQALGLPDSENQCLDCVEERLKDWMTVSPEEMDPEKIDPRYFFYEPLWRTMIGVTPGFYSERIYDHHFHYGYFLYTAGLLSLTRPEFAEKYGKLMDLLVLDIANPEEKDTRFPFMRYFDFWSGHSWADSDGMGYYGHNQESVSEALHAWAGIACWGLATKNQKWIDLGLLLYTLESETAHQYWFDVDGDLFHFPENAKYNNSLVWEGAVTKEVFFGPDPAFSHGIVLLPLSPASFHLVEHPDAMNKFFDSVSRFTEPDAKTWPDIFLGAHSILEPKKTLDSIIAAVNALPAIEEGNTKTTVAWFMAGLEEHGRPNLDIRADTAFYTVFDKEGKRAYIVYNEKDTPKKVSFSDGTSYSIPAREMSVFTRSLSH